MASTMASALCSLPGRTTVRRRSRYAAADIDVEWKGLSGQGTISIRVPVGLRGRTKGKGDGECIKGARWLVATGKWNDDAGDGLGRRKGRGAVKADR